MTSFQGTPPGNPTQMSPAGAADPFVDANGVLRLTLKTGSERTLGSETPHVEVRREMGHRIDPATGEPTSRRSPGNHREITWDCE